MTSIWSSSSSLEVERLLSSQPRPSSSSLSSSSSSFRCPVQQANQLGAANLIDEHVRRCLDHSAAQRLFRPRAANNESDAADEEPPRETSLLEQLTYVLLVGATSDSRPAACFAAAQAHALHGCMERVRALAARLAGRERAACLQAFARHLSDTVAAVESQLLRPCTLVDACPPSSDQLSLLRAALHQLSDVHCRLADLLTTAAAWLEPDTDDAVSASRLLSGLYSRAVVVEHGPAASNARAAFARVAAPFFRALRDWLDFGVVRTADFAIQPTSDSDHHLAADLPSFVRAAADDILFCGTARHIASALRSLLPPSLSLPPPTPPLDLSFLGVAGPRTVHSSASVWCSASPLARRNQLDDDDAVDSADLQLAMDRHVVEPVRAAARALDGQLMCLVEALLGGRAFVEALLHCALRPAALDQAPVDYLPNSSTPYAALLAELGLPACRHVLLPGFVRSLDRFRRFYAQTARALDQLRQTWWTAPDRAARRRTAAGHDRRQLAAAHRAVIFVQRLAQLLHDQLARTWLGHVEAGLRSGSFTRFLAGQTRAQLDIDRALDFVHAQRCVHFFTQRAPLLSCDVDESVTASLAALAAWFRRQSEK